MRLADRLRAALGRTIVPAPVPGDDFELVPGQALTPAAVLIALTDRAEPGVLLTLRQPHLRRHAGQVAFPGGRIDPGDADAIAAALREADEEVGLDPAHVEVVGATDPWRTGTGYAIVPVVGVIPPDLALTPQEAEVAAIFEVPLAFLLDSGNRAIRTIEWQGRERRFHEMIWAERRIWGATAGMIVNLSARLAEAVA